MICRGVLARWSSPRSNQRDAHGRVVHRVAQEERHAAVRPADDEVADVVARESLRPVDQVVELDDAARRHTKTQGGTGPAPMRLATSSAGSDAQVPA